MKKQVLTDDCCLFSPAQYVLPISKVFPHENQSFLLPLGDTGKLYIGQKLQFVKTLWKLQLLLPTLNQKLQILSCVFIVPDHIKDL